MKKKPAREVPWTTNEIWGQVNLLIEAGESLQDDVPYRTDFAKVVDSVCENLTVLIGQDPAEALKRLPKRICAHVCEKCGGPWQHTIAGPNVSCLLTHYTECALCTDEDEALAVAEDRILTLEYTIQNLREDLATERAHPEKGAPK